MKPNFKKIALPIGVFAIAVVGAFASNTGMQPNPNDREGYKEVNNVCEKANVTCSIIENPQMCSDGTQDLYLWESDTQCVKPLFRKVNK